MAERSGEQCTKVVRGPQRYCWSHTPKTVPITLALVSATLGFAFKQVTGKIFPSEESKRIAVAAGRLEHRLETSVEFGAPIDNLNVVIYFHQALSPLPHRSPFWVVKLQKYENPGNQRIIRVRGVPMPTLANNVERHWGFWFESLSLSGNIGPQQLEWLVTNYSIATSSQMIEALPFPVSVRPKPPQQFSHIRDLDETSVTLFVPPAHASSIRAVEVVANSSREFRRRLVLFSIHVSERDWKETEIAEHYPSEAKTDKKFTMMVAGFSAPGWKIDLRRARWHNDAAPMPDVLRQRYD